MQYHRFFGVIAWLSATLHMLTWYVKWIKEGNFGNNIATLTNLKIYTINVCTYHVMYRQTSSNACVRSITTTSLCP